MPSPTDGLTLTTPRRPTCVNAAPRTLFTVFKGEKELGRELGIPGRHNVLNALAAIALVTELGVDFPSVTRGLASLCRSQAPF